MRFLRPFLIALCVMTFCVAITPISKASQWDKKTFVTFNDPVQIPGQVLEPGTYVLSCLILLPIETSCRSGLRMKTT